MKKRLRLFGVLLLAVLCPFALFAGGGQEAATEAGYPPEMEAWLQEAKLGPYEESPQNWDEIIAKANQEGEVVVYFSSSRIGTVAEAFEEEYPQIKVTYFDLGSVQSVEKTVQEHEAGLYNADVVRTGGSGQVIYELLKKNRIVNFVPDTVAKEIPRELKEPLLVGLEEAIVFLYNEEAYGTAPIKNLWELTMPEWNGKSVIKTPLESLSNFMGVATIAQHADEMAAAYKRLTGKEIELSEGVPDAGYEFIYRLLRNDLVILKSGSKVAEASGKRGQSRPPIGITNYSYIRYNESKDFANKIMVDIDPISAVFYPTYFAIARQAPHPNAAKLFISFLMGSPEIDEDTKLEPPYTEGRSLELLQGMAPYYQAGERSPRDDVPPPPGGEIWFDLKAWSVDPEFMWYEGPKVQDFWVQEAAE
jgi:iron(III) transport system substrate-binding protein